MDAVFLCYRRTDGDVVRRIKDALVDRMGESNVFLDVDAIQWDYGKDFRTVIRETIRIVSTVVVVIGNGNWAERLREPDDVVFLELREALEQRKFILPALIDGAVMPRARELPSELADFAFFNAVHLHSGPDFDQDVKQLLLGMYMEMLQRKLKSEGSTFIRAPDGSSGAV